MKGFESVKISLDEDDIHAIDQATREVLSQKGVVFDDLESLDYLGSIGCDVDQKSRVVKIPGKVLDRCLESAPSSFSIYGRDVSAPVLQGAGSQICYSTYGPSVRILNYQGHGRYEIKDSAEEDLSRIVRLCDWADNIDFISTPVSAGDWIDHGCKDLHEIRTCIANTTKHYHHIEPRSGNVGLYWQVARALRGGDENAARDKPPLSVMACPTGPLKWDRNEAEVIYKSAKLGIPVNILSISLAGASAPIFLSGTMVIQNAEVLSGIVLSQAVRPGSKVWYGSSSTVFDPRNAIVSFGSPESGLISGATAQMARFYGLPSFCTGMMSDSKTLDSQTSYERTMNSLLPSLGGASTIYGMGTIERGLTFSPEQLVIDNEYVRMTKMVTSGIDLDRLSQSMDIIMSLDPSNMYLDHPSTIQNMDLISKPRVFDRSEYRRWVTQGGKHVEDVAHEIVLKVLSEHEVPPLPSSIMEKINEIVNRADVIFARREAEFHGKLYRQGQGCHNRI